MLIFKGAIDFLCQVIKTTTPVSQEHAEVGTIEEDSEEPSATNSNTDKPRS